MLVKVAEAVNIPIKKLNRCVKFAQLGTNQVCRPRIVQVVHLVNTMIKQANRLVKNVPLEHTMERRAKKLNHRVYDVELERIMMKKEKLQHRTVKPAQLADTITSKGNLFVPFAILESMKIQQEVNPV